MPRTHLLAAWRNRLFSHPLQSLSILGIVWCLSILSGRMLLTGCGQYKFLAWNLFLAAVPLLWSQMLATTNRVHHFWILAALWLLFFPNAPYVLTDFIHLHRKSHAAIPVWYDVGMLVNFGVLALFFGLVSLRQVHLALEKRTSQLTAAAIISGCTLLAGFGIYVGRFLRWNSWDIVTRPLALMIDIADRFAHPFSHPRTWGFTIMYGGTILLLYWFAYLATSRSEATRTATSR